MRFACTKSQRSQAVCLVQSQMPFWAMLQGPLPGGRGGLGSALPYVLAWGTAGEYAPGGLPRNTGHRTPAVARARQSPEGTVRLSDGACACREVAPLAVRDASPCRRGATGRRARIATAGEARMKAARKHRLSGTCGLFVAPMLGPLVGFAQDESRAIDGTTAGGLLKCVEAVAWPKNHQGETDG